MIPEKVHRRAKKRLLLLLLLIALVGITPINVVYASVSVVGTSTNSYGAGTSDGRKGFYAAGRFWIFYSDGTNGGFKSSTDGSSWSAFTSIGAASNGQFVAACFDGTYVYYARTTGATNTPIYFRRGTPLANGTISWSATEQTAVSAQSGITFYGQIGVVANSGCYPFITYGRNTGTYRVAYISKSSKNDGTWTTDSGFPYALGLTTDTSWEGCQAVALTNGRIYVTYCRDYVSGGVKGWNLFGRIYDPSVGWGAKELIQANYNNGLVANSWSSVAEGDTVHIVYLRLPSTAYKLAYRKRTSDNISAAETIQTSISATSYPSISLRKFGGGILTCFWVTSSHIYYKNRDSSGWDDSETDWKTDTFPANYYFCSFDIDYEKRLGFVWTNKTASPYNVKFDWLETTQELGFNVFQFIGSTTQPWTGQEVTLKATWYTTGTTIIFQNYTGSAWVSLGSDTVDSDGYATLSVSHYYNSTTTYRAYINDSYYSPSIQLSWSDLHIFNTGRDFINYMVYDQQDSAHAPNIGHGMNADCIWATIGNSTATEMGLGLLNITNNGLWTSWNVTGGYNRGVDLCSNATHVFFGDVPSSGQTGHLFVFKKATHAFTTYNLQLRYAAANFAYDYANGDLWFSESNVVSPDTSCKISTLFHNGTLVRTSITTSSRRPAGSGGFIFDGYYWTLYHGDEGYLGRMKLSDRTYNEYYIADTSYQSNYLEHFCFDGSQYLYIYHYGAKVIIKFDVTSKSIVARYNTTMMGTKSPHGGGLYVNGTTTLMWIGSDTTVGRMWVWDMSQDYDNASQTNWEIAYRLASATRGPQFFSRWASTAYGYNIYSNIVNSTFLPNIEGWNPSLQHFGQPGVVDLDVRLYERDSSGSASGLLEGENITVTLDNGTLSSKAASDGWCNFTGITSGTMVSGEVYWNDLFVSSYSVELEGDTTLEIAAWVYAIDATFEGVSGSMEVVLAGNNATLSQLDWAQADYLLSFYATTNETGNHLCKVDVSNIQGTVGDPKYIKLGTTEYDSGSDYWVGTSGDLFSFYIPFASSQTANISWKARSDSGTGGGGVPSFDDAARQIESTFSTFADSIASSTYGIYNSIAEETGRTPIVYIPPYPPIPIFDGVLIKREPVIFHDRYAIRYEFLVEGDSKAHERAIGRLTLDGNRYLYRVVVVNASVEAKIQYQYNFTQRGLYAFSNNPPFLSRQIQGAQNLTTVYVNFANCSANFKKTVVVYAQVNQAVNNFMSPTKIGQLSMAFGWLIVLVVAVCVYVYSELRDRGTLKSLFYAGLSATFMVLMLNLIPAAYSLGFLDLPLGIVGISGLLVYVTFTDGGSEETTEGVQK